MSQFKHPDFMNKYDYNLYYTDTDSIFIDKSPEELEALYPNSIGKKIGQLKLEYSIDRAIFLAPKAYFLYGLNGTKDRLLKVKGLNSKILNDSSLSITNI